MDRRIAVSVLFAVGLMACEPAESEPSDDDGNPPDGAAVVDAHLEPMDAGPVGDDAEVDVDTVDAALADVGPAPDAAAACPVSVSPGTAQNVDAPGVLTFDAGDFVSTPPGAQFRWSFLAIPAESRTAIFAESYGDPRARPPTGWVEDDPLTPEALAYLDVLGAYRVGLAVIRDDCEPVFAEIELTALDITRLRIELTWETPGDPMPEDTDGADLDLSLLRTGVVPLGREAEACDFRNRNPDWGEPDDPTDDPSLEVDDEDGEGPEAITLDRLEPTPEGGEPYVIRVKYFRSEHRLGPGDWGPSTARLTVHVDGLPAWAGQHQLDETGDQWDAAQVWLDGDRVVVEPLPSDAMP